MERNKKSSQSQSQYVRDVIASFTERWLPHEQKKKTKLEKMKHFLFAHRWCYRLNCAYEVSTTNFVILPLLWYCFDRNECLLPRALSSLFVCVLAARAYARKLGQCRRSFMAASDKYVRVRAIFNNNYFYFASSTEVHTVKSLDDITMLYVAFIHWNYRLCCSLSISIERQISYGNVANGIMSWLTATAAAEQCKFSIQQYMHYVMEFPALEDSMILVGFLIFFFGFKTFD